MAFHDPVSEQLREVAWSIAIRRVQHPGPIPADPQDTLASDDERRAGCLALLRAYARMSKAIQRRIDLTADAALGLGASYGQVAEACGVSRQAARQRWLRRHKEQDKADEARRQAAPPGYDYDPSPPGPGSRSALSSDRSEPSAAMPPDSPRAGARVRKARVYELAAEFGVEAKVVMARLQEMGEFVRSASSTVEAPVARRLREGFSASGGPAGNT